MSSATYLAPGVYVEEVPSAQQPIAGVGTNVVGFIGIVPKTIYIPVPNPDYDPVAARAALELDAVAARRAQLEPDKATHTGEIADLDEREHDAATELRGAVQRLNATLDTLQKNLTTALNAVKAAEKEQGDAEARLKDLEGKFEHASPDDQAAQQQDLDKARATFAAKDKALRTAMKRQSDVEADIAARTTERDEANARLPDSAKAAAGGEGAAGAGGGGAPAGTPAKPEGAPAGEAADNSPAGREAAYFKDMQGTPPGSTPSVLRPYVLKQFAVKVDSCDTKLCTNFTEYTQRFGTFSAYRDDPEGPPDNPDKWTFRPLHPGHHALTHAVNGFFKNGGTKAFVARVDGADQLEKVLKNFRSIDEIAIIAAPGLPRTPDTWESLMSHVEGRENCFAILDSPEEVVDDDGDLDVEQLEYSGAKSILPRVCKNAAFYFPHIEVTDPAKQLQDTDPGRKVTAKYRGRTYVPPSGHMAGIYARTDTERGVHKAPANCVVRGAVEVRYYISKPLQEMLNPQGVNAIRLMNNTVTVWGARTMGGDKNSEWKYISVRRLFLFLQKSIEDGTQWIVFEPNDEALWGKIRLNITAFLTNVWRTGALFGLTPEQAFYVKCDAELNPPEVRDLGQVITEIGVAIVRPAEFVIFRITQSTGITQA